jgi:hypothetical protein
VTTHPLFERLLRKIGGSLDEPPTLDAWRQLAELVSRTYRDGDQERYTTERAMDISSHEMQELFQELRRSEERHRLLFEANPVPMWAVDRETLLFVDVNTAMIRTYGYSRAELLAMRATDVNVPGEGQETVDAVRDASLGSVLHLGVRRHRCKDGTVLDVDVTVHALVLDQRPCVLGIAIDMTRARLVEEELRQAQKLEAIGRLAGGIAHDFNNILAVIHANTEFALAELPRDHAAVESLLDARKATSRGAGLTRQLLTFSRKQPRQSKPLALNVSVVGVEKLLRLIIGEDIAMSATIAPDLGLIEADPGEIEQVVMNLLVNARDAMPDGGRLRLETANVTIDPPRAVELGVRPGAYVMLSVADTGCGMPPEVRARIFEPFFTTKDVDRGTGLGLSIVFGIVKEGGGAIAVETAPGCGTTFRIYWPRTDQPAAPAQEAPSLPVRGSGTVLVAEDDEQLRHILRRYLTSWGYRVLLAGNGVEALEASHAHAGAIDLLLTDLVMPGGIDGRSLSEQLLRQRPGLRVVFMSGYTEHPAMRSAQLGPGDLFVPKPFSARVLSETIASAFSPSPAASRVA